MDQLKRGITQELRWPLSMDVAKGCYEEITVLNAHIMAGDHSSGFVKGEGSERRSHKSIRSLAAVLQVHDGEPRMVEVDTKASIPSILSKL